MRTEIAEWVVHIGKFTEIMRLFLQEKKRKIFSTFRNLNQILNPDSKGESKIMIRTLVYKIGVLGKILMHFIQDGFMGLYK